jgi:MoaA/NifB/PqqE/SkfB family radical SAM enzyme
MKLPHKTFCVLPWVSLEASPIGTVRPCCLAEEEILDEHGQKFDLRTARFKDIQRSEHMSRLRQAFLAGERPATCRKCWNEERAGRTSKRMHTLDRLKHVIDSVEWTLDAQPLIFLDLKLGNICNLKCRICGSWSSSQFATEELHFTPAAEKKISQHYHMLQAGAWPRENTAFWQEIDQVLDQIRYIEFTGGEPFMIREHFDMLRGMVDRGVAPQVEIHYNTNGTQWPEGADEIWHHFKTVEIAFSIDDLGERFEYQRTNAVWQQVCDNIAKFRNLRDRYHNIRLQVCSTVNIFNVMYLDQLAAWIDHQDFDFIYWNMLHEPYYWSVSTMPNTVKHQVLQRLAEAQVSQVHRKEFDRIKDFISNGVALDGDILRMKLADLDRRRRQDLRHHHNELAEALGYEGPR